MQDIYEILMPFLKYKDILQFSLNVISFFSICYGWVVYLKHKGSKIVSLQNGKYRFKVKRENFNSTDLTNIVSTLYFDGKTIDGELRQEIFKITGTTGKIINDNE